MVGQDEDDNIPDVSPRKGGMMLAEDDLEVGQYVCVYNLKKEPNEGAPIMGQSLHIKAICLPYFVGQLLSDPSEPVLTLDVRYLNLMRVTKEFVEAQQQGAKAAQQQQQQEGGLLMAVPRKKRQNRQEEG